MTAPFVRPPKGWVTLASPFGFRPFTQENRLEHAAPYPARCPRRPRPWTAGRSRRGQVHRLIDGVLEPGARDTLLQQLSGMVDGSHPNGLCVDRPDTNNGGAVTCPPNGENSFLNLTIPGPQRG